MIEIGMDTRTIQEVTSAIIDYRGKTPPKASSGIKLITAKVIKDGAIVDGNHEYISQETYQWWMRRGMPQQWDILLTTEAPLGEVAQLRTPEHIALAQRVILLRGNPCLIDQGYFFQALKSPFFQAELAKRATGTTVLGIKQSELRRARIPYYPLPIQRKIAAILSAYDDLIENNTRRIALLEAMAQALYREWFVRFRFPGHEAMPLVDSPLGAIPEGWSAYPFAELLQSTRGGDWGSDSLTAEETCRVAVLRGTDFDDIRLGNPSRAPLRYINERSLRVRQLRPGDVIVENSVNAKTRTVGNSLLITPGILRRLGTNVICASFCKLFRPREPGLGPILHLQLRHLYTEGRMAFYQNVAANGIGNFQATRFVQSESLLLPDSVALRTNAVQMFGDLTSSSLADTNANLRQTRDLLLPRLVSGAVDVAGMEISARDE